MIDAITKEPLQVGTGYPPKPHIRVAVDFVDAVRRVLDNNGFRYYVMENQISRNGGPYMTRIVLERGTNAAAVQQALDCVP